MTFRKLHLFMVLSFTIATILAFGQILTASAGEDAADRGADPLLITSQSVVVCEIEPSDCSGLIDQDRRRPRHSPKSDGNPDRDAKDLPSQMLQTGSVEPTQAPRHGQIRIDEDGESKAVSLHVRPNRIEGPVCHGHDVHTLTLQPWAHPFQPLQLSGAVRSPGSPIELEQRPSAVPLR